eukprot:CAMPEP_0172416152 /NCGR_PEP_ID=MMETSP1064-20121228/2588_1 /TAXON_ID=202472 /ORGANISM="Aulacoseira subarctica , Strain CCAP 1002/5" /LENGTH=615 /DNA_ID=CAMNT_0013153575 /DNA_START=50 /DNA_END=1897 /DNA_ORIENTATION=+
MRTNYPISSSSVVLILLATGAISSVKSIAGFNNNNYLKSCARPPVNNAIRSSSWLQLSPLQMSLKKKDGDDIDDSSYDNSNNNSNNNNNNNNSIEEKRNIHKEQLEAALGKSRAQAEIHRLLLDDNTPSFFDREGAVANLPFIPSPMDAFEALVEEQVAELERTRTKAINSEDFVAAQKARDELYRVHVDDCGHVLQVNAAFYKAIRDENYAQMQSVWLQADEIQCIHPAQPPLAGYDAVLSSWKESFESSSSSSSTPNNSVEPVNVRLLSLKGCTAVLVCEEHIYRTSLQRGVGRKRELVKKIQSTNVFRKVDDQWYLIHHHGSWYAEPPNNKSLQRGKRPAIRNHRGEIIQGPAVGDVVDAIRKIYFGSTSNTNNEGKNNKNDFSISKLMMGGNTNGADGSGKNVRIFRGTLSDFLKGGMLEALTSGGKENDDDNEDDEDDDEYQASKDGVAWIEASEVDEDNDEEDTVDDEDDISEEEYLRKVLNLRKQGRWEGGKYIPRKNNDEKQGSVRIVKRSSEKISSANKSSSGFKDEMRQSCITALRRLCNQGSISNKQKRVLLTDIITCSSKGEFSMVEVAYELLCGEGDDKDAAEEEFAEQCRAFATTSMDSDA